MARAVMVPACPEGEHWYRYGWYARPWWLEDGDAYVRTISRVCERCHRWQEVEQRIPLNHFVDANKMVRMGVE